MLNCWCTLNLLMWDCSSKSWQYLKSNKCFFQLWHLLPFCVLNFLVLVYIIFQVRKLYWCGNTTESSWIFWINQERLCFGRCVSWNAQISWTWGNIHCNLSLICYWVFSSFGQLLPTRGLFFLILVLFVKCSRLCWRKLKMRKLTRQSKVLLS
jgi:hypothetical protein